MNWTKDIKITNEDNMALMSRYPDNYFDLAIVDPPYGSDNIKGGYTSGKGGGISKQKNYHQEIWNQCMPTKAYFKELKRVSKNQIIWGANHFIQNIPESNSSCWVVWDKQNGNNSFSDCEMAYTSFRTALRKFEFRWQGMLQGDMKNKETRIHPTQKPVQLYKWLLQNYAKQGDKILDTHLGSGSIALACHELGFELTACELDKEYYDAAFKRFKEQTAQLRMAI
jgi:site-specific DNA-methyltransferase (adenine-specific)